MTWRDVETDDGFIEFEAVGNSGRVYRVEWAKDSPSRPWRFDGKLFRTEPEAKAYCEQYDFWMPRTAPKPAVQWQEVLRAVTDDYKHNYEVNSGEAFERVWDLLKAKGVAV